MFGDSLIGYCTLIDDISGRLHSAYLITFTLKKSRSQTPPLSVASMFRRKWCCPILKLRFIQIFKCNIIIENEEYSKIYRRSSLRILRNLKKNIYLFIYLFLKQRSNEILLRIINNNGFKCYRSNK